MASFEKKFALAQEYQEMLERMKKEDPGRYQQMKLDAALRVQVPRTAHGDRGGKRWKRYL